MRASSLTPLHWTTVYVHLCVDSRTPKGVQVAVAECTDLQRGLTVGEQQLIGMQRTLSNDLSATESSYRNEGGTWRCRAEPIPKGWEGEQADRRVDRRHSE